MKATVLTTRNWLEFLPEISPLASARLDALRAAAAVMVLVSHVRGVFFPLYSDLETRGPIVTAFYALGTLGHPAVLIFFVLSGFLVSLSAFRMQARGEWSVQRYFVQRLVRLWIVFIPALLLTLGWDWLGIQLWGATIYRGIPENAYILPQPLASLNAPTFIGNLIFLQTIYVEPFGSNGPLWSLANEWWYYVAFPIALGLIGHKKLPVRIFFAALLIGLGCMVGISISLLFSIWLAGVFAIFLGVFARAKSFKPSIHWHKFWVLALAVSLVLANKSVVIGNTCLVLSTLGLIACWIFPTADEASQITPRWITFAKKMADFSFSLYLVHMPPLAFVYAFLYERGVTKLPVSYSSLFLAFLLTLGILLYAYLVSRLTEAHNNKVRSKIENRFQKFKIS